MLGRVWCPWVSKACSCSGLTSRVTRKLWQHVKTLEEDKRRGKAFGPPTPTVSGGFSGLKSTSVLMKHEGAAKAEKDSELSLVRVRGKGGSQKGTGKGLWRMGPRAMALMLVSLASFRSGVLRTFPLQKPGRALAVWAGPGVLQLFTQIRCILTTLPW